MKIIHSSALCLVLLGSAVRLLFGAEPPQKLPDAEIQAFLDEQKMPSIQVKPGGRLARDYAVDWMKWCERVVIEPFVARLDTDAATKEIAAHVAREGIMMIKNYPQRDFAFTSEKMVEECEALLKAKVDDPLVYWLQSWSYHDSTRDFPGCERIFNKGLKHAKLKDALHVLRYLMIVSFDDLRREARKKAGHYENDAAMIESAKKSMLDGTYRAEDEEIMIENLVPVFYEATLKAHEKKILEICELPELSEWSRVLLVAPYHLQMGWIARGHNWANQVKPEGWKGFEEHRKMAHEAYLKAWKLHPERPRAALDLTDLATTGGVDDEGAQAWLERTLAAQFDNMSAYRAMLNGLLPRWGGSHEQMLAFGLACAQTQRYDTEVPYFFFEALKAVVKELDDWQPLCRQPLIASVAIALSKQRVQDAATPLLKQDALAMLGTYAWMCGDYKTAAEALSQVPGRFTRPVILTFLGYHINELIVRGESAIFADGLEKEWLAAEEAMKAKDLDVAAKIYEKAGTWLKGTGADYAASALAIVHFERELMRGDWVPLRVDPKLTLWRIQKGDWEGTADGVLINHGKGTSATILHRGRVGTEFQIRGEFESEGEGLGVILGHGFVENKEHWITCAHYGTSGKGQAYILDNIFASSINKVDVAKHDSPHSFLVTCHAGKITYVINGVTVYDQVVPCDMTEPDVPLKLMQDGSVGFFHNEFKAGKQTRILKAEVKLLR